MVLRENAVLDIMGAGGERILVRYDDEDLATVACGFEYDVMLSNYDSMRRYPDSCRVMVPRKVEVSDGEGGWKSYPSVVLARGLDAMGLRAQTIALVRITGQEELSVVYSKNLEPDRMLLEAAKADGIHTEMWEV